MFHPSTSSRATLYVATPEVSSVFPHAASQDADGFLETVIADPVK
jgi:hypothetical protein